ncbi:MAG: DUF3108 domain-containing protein [Candidatus Marinimicrobia bacterium]|nr:DUF3108 domain-containing protein [Candidatus Neomarinimicrobiota bacterium]
MRKCCRIVLLILLLAGGMAVGQDFSFKVKYGMIQAGHAHLTLKVHDGYLKGHLNIESSPWLSKLWSLSDSIKSDYDIKSGQLQSHIKSIHEGAYHRNYEVHFTDSNSVLINGRERVLATQGLRDIPSLLYDLSRMHFSHGDTLHFRLWDGQGFGKLELLAEQSAGPSLLHPFAEAGWKLIPLSSSRKSRENRIQLTLLLSETFPHTPIKIEIDTKYGSILMQVIMP